KQRSRKGRHVSHRMWIDHEWQVLNLLYESGASVPKPYARCNEGILMELIGDGAHAAPMLVHVQLTPDEARAVFQAILRDVEILLGCGLVHGDLSAFNILYEKGKPTIIDLPQAIEVDAVADGWSLFYRDLENICSYFRRQGMNLDTLDLATKLWARFVR
ncbi:MAG: serine protein kinase RIO, partial [Gammaproteobacteria bacterium]|nr:serine protein kinase RIO [Gammaproteobacteria bacterium]